MAKSRATKVKAAEETTNLNQSTVIGQFEGMCADANITNENGLDITREVWETVFASDLYKQAIDLGWYIGYLGHPEDPNCMDFEHACIVMREGHIDNDGKIYGKFDLVDTPVGKIVKSFIDAGVTFGISVRGAGDIVNNSVDPETFVFRGFDLVSFPAYKEAIPTFTQIAASTDVEKQQKYKAVCAAVKNNLQSLNSAEAIDIIQEQFAPQSEEYQLLEDHKVDILPDIEEPLDITDEQLEGVMQLYLEEKKKNSSLAGELLAANTKLKNASTTYRRKLASIKRITASQSKDMEDELFRTVNAYQTIKASSSKLKAENERLITASIKLRQENEDLTRSNLKYKQRIEATADDIRQKDSVISSLRTELGETVNAVTESEVKTSNLDAKIKKLQDEVSAATALIEDYQNAYATLYANALGVHLKDVRVTSSTSVKELQSIISSSNIQNQSISEPECIDVIDTVDDGGLVTM